MRKETVILGIESSCDETGVGVVRGMQVLSNCIASSSNLHAQYGGVVPELAARAHIDYIVPTIKSALLEAGVALSDIDAFAVTAGPGLPGCLLVGAASAKALAAACKKPVYAIHHLAGHIAAGFGFGKDYAPNFLPCKTPCIALLASGGHTVLFRLDSNLQIEMIGATIDDAAGEAMDKAARLLGLGYPGGAALDALAQGGREEYAFPRALSSQEHMPKYMYDFSFSGLKTALLRQIALESGGFQSKQNSPQQITSAKSSPPQRASLQNSDTDTKYSPHTVLNETQRADLAASFISAIVDVLVAKSIAACTNFKINNLLVVGGVAANSQLRAALQKVCQERSIELVLPPLSMCGDNGAMIALGAAMRISAGGEPSNPNFSIFTSAACKF